MEFKKTVLPYLRCVVNEVKEHEQMGEIRLPDGLPDVGRVLCTWGQVVIRGKEWRGNGMTLSGGVQVKILYEPDGDVCLQCTDSWIPFQVKWDFGNIEKDGVICARPYLLGVDSRTASARKLIIRARVGVAIKAMVNDSLYIPEAPELPSDVQVLKRTYPLRMATEAGEKAFNLEDVMQRPEERPALEKIVSYTVQPVLSEMKLMGDKLVFRGLGRMHLVYMDNDNRLRCWDHDIPFSQYAQLEAEYDDTADVGVDFAITGVEVEPLEGDGYQCRIGLAAQYIVYNCCLTEMIEDVFSPIRQIHCTMDEIEIPAVLDRKEMRVQGDCEISADIKDIADISFYPGIPGTYTEDDEVYADLGGSFQVVGYDMMGTAISESEKWDKAFPLKTDQYTHTEINLLPADKLECEACENGVSVHGQMLLEIITMNCKPITLITGADFGEAIEQNPERPSVIIRRCGEDSLWKIAKDSGSSVEAIIKANNLEGEPMPDQIILVPIM